MQARQSRAAREPHWRCGAMQLFEFATTERLIGKRVGALICADGVDRRGRLSHGIDGAR